MYLKSMNIFIWGLCSSGMLRNTSIRLVVYYRCFKAAYQFHLQAYSSPKTMPGT